MNLQKVVAILVRLGRFIVGGTIIFTGVQLIRGEGLLSYSYGQFDSFITGIFVILIGFFCILGAIRPSVLE